MEVVTSIALGLAYMVFTETVVFRLALGHGVYRLFGKVLIINVASVCMAASIALLAYYYLGWPSPASWGGSHWFLLVIICEFLPLSILFGDLGFRRVFTLLIFSNILSTLLLSFLLVYAPGAVMMPDLELSVQEDKVERGIGIIADALEKYAVAKGEYPGYIYGGDSSSWSQAGESLDPLLKGGYLDVYPANPYHPGNTFYFSRRRPGLEGFFWGLENHEFEQLKRAWGEVVEDDPRFGMRGTRMGNILTDRNVPSSMFVREYRVYRGKGDKMFFLPGSFLYRAFDTDSDGKFDSYILAGFGSEDARGKDIYDRVDDRVTYVVDGKLYPGKSDGKPDGVIVVETGGFEKWRE